LSKIRGMAELIQQQEREGVTLLTLNREKSLNALNFALLEELRAKIRELAFTDDVVVITGAGKKAFSAGADVKEMLTFDQKRAQSFIEFGRKVLDELREAPFVSVAALNGLALGGGFELALACDLIYAKEGVKMGLPEIHLGLIPGFGGTQYLKEALGKRLAKEIIFHGDQFTAEQAKEWGIVTRIFKESFIDDVLSLTKEGSQLKRAKGAVNGGMDHELVLFMDSFADEASKEKMKKLVK